MRHYNSIVAGFQIDPPVVMPVWTTQDFRGKTYESGEGWASGFVQGMRLWRDDWQPMLATDEGKAWIRPIGLLGEDAYSPDHRREPPALTSTVTMPNQREATSLQQ